MKKHADINKTFEILNGYVMNNNELNEEYFLHLVKVTAENTEHQYNLLKSRMKSINIALCWVMFFINTELEYNGYSQYICNLYHLKAYEKDHKSLITVIEQLTNYINEVRTELKTEG